MPLGHAWEPQRQIAPEQLVEENVLLLCTGNCFPRPLLECPALNRSAFSSDGHHSTLEGSSLHHHPPRWYSPAAGQRGAGHLGRGQGADSRLLSVRPFSEPSPSRTVVLARRKSFPRPAVIDAVRDAFGLLDLPSALPLP